MCLEFFCLNHFLIHIIYIKNCFRRRIVRFLVHILASGRGDVKFSQKATIIQHRMEVRVDVQIF